MAGDRWQVAGGSRWQVAAGGRWQVAELVVARASGEDEGKGREIGTAVVVCPMAARGEK